MFRRPFVGIAAAACLVLPACGSDDSASSSTPAAAGEQAAVFVTADCGKEVVVARTDVEPGNAMRALDTVADIETDDGGKFVTAIEGREQDTGKKLAWLFYVDGKMAQKGASEITLAPGDVEWWDLHDYEQECATVPAHAR